MPPQGSMAYLCLPGIEPWFSSIFLKKLPHKGQASWKQLTSYGHLEVLLRYRESLRKKYFFVDLISCEPLSVLGLHRSSSGIGPHTSPYDASLVA